MTTPCKCMGAFLMLLLMYITSGECNSASGVLQNDSEDPEFTDIIENITAPAGRNVKLSCSVKNLGPYKVAWIHFEQSAILTVHNHVITRNPRISVTHDKHDKHRTWFLHINDVKEEDRGRYMCQINTVTAKTQFGYLHVVVPPDIDDAYTSTDVVVREGTAVVLKCKANGSPKPSVRWKRDDNFKIYRYRNDIGAIEYEGESLEMKQISRESMGAYLCIASNGIPPTVSKRIKVNVDFIPSITIPEQLVGIPHGYNITIVCLIEAFPVGINLWIDGSTNEVIHPSEKYKTELITGSPSYKLTMALTIHRIQHNDYGDYKCKSKNSRGESDGNIRIYLSSAPTTISPPPSSSSTTITTIETLIYDNKNILNNHMHYNKNNNSIYGGKSSSSFSINLSDKGSRYQSNLNEIDKSEHKSHNIDGTKGFDYTTQKDDKSNKNSCNNLKNLSKYLIFIPTIILTLCHLRIL